MKMSELMRPRLLQDFLIPHLDQGTFGDRLCWVDREEKMFKIFWRHQSSSKFSPEDSSVFREWAIAKGLWDPTDLKCLTKAKQRLRAALLKLRSVECIHKNGESRIYRIVSGHDLTYLDDLENNRFIDLLLSTNFMPQENFFY